MWIVLAALSELALLYWLFSLFGYIIALPLFIYVGLRYLDGTEYTGAMNWHAFRRLRVWRWLSPVMPPHTSADYGNQPQVQNMYVLVSPNESNCTYSALVWGIGLHGGTLHDAMASSLLYVVPAVYMWVPLLREVLQWSGAVCAGGAHPLRLVLQDALHRRHSVAYYASITADAYGGVPSISDDMLDFARQTAACLAPVAVFNEHERYWTRAFNWGGCCWSRCRYPFPVISLYRLFAPKRPPRLRLVFGHLTRCDPLVYTDAKAIRSQFEEGAKRLVCTDVGETPIKFTGIYYASSSRGECWPRFAGPGSTSRAGCVGATAG